MIVATKKLTIFLIKFFMILITREMSLMICLCIIIFVIIKCLCILFFKYAYVFDGDTFIIKEKDQVLNELLDNHAYNEEIYSKGIYF
jgi:hypothetical protein